MKRVYVLKTDDFEVVGIFDTNEAAANAGVDFIIENAKIDEFDIDGWVEWYLEDNHIGFYEIDNYKEFFFSHLEEMKAFIKKELSLHEPDDIWIEECDGTEIDWYIEEEEDK